MLRSGPTWVETLLLELLANDIDARPASAAVVAERLAAMSLRWTRAEAWWNEHLPELVAPEAADSPADGRSSRQHDARKTA